MNNAKDTFLRLVKLFSVQEDTLELCSPQQSYIVFALKLWYNG